LLSPSLFLLISRGI